MAPLVYYITTIIFSLWVSSNVVEGHGRLLTPPSRSSMWRYGFKTPPNYNDMELFCGGFTRQWNQNGGRCGICGDPWDASHPRDNEEGGKYGKGIVVKSYTQGQIIEAVVELTANHQGYFEFRVCPANNNGVEVTQECLDQNHLSLSDGSGNKYYLPAGSGNGMFSVQLQLPPNLHCSRCVFQWIYTSGNNWGQCEDGSQRVGCGPQEQFRGCADVSIGYSENEIPVEAPPTTTTTTPSWITRRWETITTTTPSWMQRRQWESRTTTTTTTPPPWQQRSTWGYPEEVAPTMPPTNEAWPPAAQRCTAVGIWRTVVGMTAWCITNCQHIPPFCPPSHCICH
ncbi:hypothetical protein CHUAL_012695 [Chamberlinius hualienensis]